MIENKADLHPLTDLGFGNMNYSDQLISADYEDGAIAEGLLTCGQNLKINRIHT